METTPTCRPAELDAFWARCITAGAVSPDTPRPKAVEAFGDHPELADELLALILAGTKRATAGALVDYARSGDPVPHVGGLTVVTDGAGHPRALIRTTEVRIGPLSSVDDGFAYDEGEGDRTRASWLAIHERFFRRFLPTIQEAYDPDMPTVFERFELVWSE